MAEQQHPPGWWQAENGNWYPPNVRNPHQPSPATSPSPGPSSHAPPGPPAAGFCPQCATPLATASWYCPGCGVPLAASGPPSPWAPQGAYNPAPYPTSPGNGYSTAGTILGVIAFLCLPIIAGPAGLICGAIAKSRGEPNASIALWVSGLGTVVGLILGVMLFSAI